MLNGLFYAVYLQCLNLSFDVQILCFYKYLDNPLKYLVEQNLPFPIKVADYTHVLSKGTIVYSSTPGESR